MAEWLVQTTFEHSLDDTLYGVADEVDRRIKAGLWTGSHASRAISNWAVAKLLMSDQFTREHWVTLGC